MRAGALVLLFVLSGCRTQAAAPGCALVLVEYVESFDIGHGGSSRTGRITRTAPGYDVTVASDTPFPRHPDEPPPHSSRKDLRKSREDVLRFLDGLVSRLKIRELRSSKPKFMGLHPTFATLRFQDSCGAKGEVEYVFEGEQPQHPSVRPVVEALREFFRE